MEDRTVDTADTDPAAAAVVHSLLAIKAHQEAMGPLYATFLAAVKAAPHWINNPANLVAVGWEELMFLADNDSGVSYGPGSLACSPARKAWLVRPA